MKKVKITVVKIANHQDLIDKYELPLKLPCSMKVGDVYLCEGHVMPKNFCEHAWESLSPFVLALAYGASDIYDNWMKNKNSAMVSCNDGFRPVSFYLETIEEDNQ